MNCKFLFKMSQSKPGSKFFIMFSLLLFLWIEPAKAQSPYLLPEVFPNAPNTAEIAKHGDYSVNLFTGLPDISIPLYEIQSGDLKVPVTLNYHASGIKVSDVASFVGLGWSLNAGGVINRKLMGSKADENLSEDGYMAGNLLKIMNFTAEEEDLKLEYYDRVRKSFIDVQPDIFSYSFPGHNGKFFFDGMNDYRPVLIPYSPIDLQYSVTNEQLSFNIKDAKGNQYIFGKNYKESVTNNQGNYSVTAWNLEEIISQKGQDSIQFTYTKSGFTSPTTYSNAWVVDDLVEIYHGETPVYSANPQASSVESSHYSSINEQQLSEILFKDGKVVFGLSGTNREDIDAKSLDNIKIYSFDHVSQQYTLQKTIQFHYSYFVTNDVYSTKRLKLDSIKVLDSGSNPIQRYSFDYNTDVMLPSPGSKAVDYWGYYNGKDNDMLIPQEEVNFEESGSTTTETIGSKIVDGRESDPDFNQACVLKSIHYPTGGYTDFEYETNRYIDDYGEVKLGGGLRVKSIKSYDGFNATPLEKQYEYGDGRSNFEFGSYSFKITQTYRYYHLYSGGYQYDETKRSRTFVSNPTVDVVPFDAAAVVYPEVTEYYGSSDKNSGKTIYRFRDKGDVINIRSTSNNNKPITDSYFYARGQLKEKEHYKLLSSGNYQIVSKESFTYSVFQQRIHETVGLVIDKHTINQLEGGGGDVLILPSSSIKPDDSNSFGENYYSINTDDNYLKSKTIIRYDPEDETKYTIQTTDYIYDNIAHQQVTKEKTQDSKGSVHEKRMKYPADFIPEGGSSTGNATLDAMLTRNMQAVPVEEWSTQTTGTSTLTTAAQINLYQQLSLGSIVPASHQRLEIKEPTATFEPSSIVSGKIQADTRYGRIINFDAYDDKDNLVQYTARNSSPVAIIWGYNQRYPIAEVKNAQNTLAIDPSKEATSTKDVIVLSNSTTTDLYTIDFTVQRSGDGEIKLNFNNAPDSDDTGTIVCSVSGPNGFLQDNIKVCISSSSGCGSIPSSVLIPFSDTGDYTLTAKLESNLNIDTDIRLILDYPTAGLSGVKEFFFENFEESGVEGQAHTGKKFYSGDYTVEFELPNNRPYIISYWYREHGVWKLEEEPYNGPNKTLTRGDAIDDVRIHPKDALMTTYTYEPFIGTASSIDPAGVTIFYEYDKFGRLQYLKDNSGNILKKNEYHFISQ
jgi:hypothetical protein